MIKKFSDYLILREQEGVDSPFDNQDKPKPSNNKTEPLDKEQPTQFDTKTPNQVEAKPKWKMTKSQIIQFWKSLPMGLPIAMNPIAFDHEGSTFSEDAIRITGSTEFIKSVLCRLKEFLTYESDKTKLNISFRETSSPSLEQEGLAKTSYVFYLQTKERG